MAQKSKSQRARASARKAERKAAAAREEAALVDKLVADGADPEEAKATAKAELAKQEKPAETKPVKKDAKDDKPAKKKKDGFFANVRAEMKRVTWPTRQDVIRWSAVVVVALIFFSAYVFVLDNWIVTPLLMLISGLSGTGA